MEDFYFDSSIWIDIYEKREHNGEVAKKLFEKIINEDHKIFYSDLVLVELKRVGYSIEEINPLLKVAKPNNLRRAHIYEKQINEARKLAKQRNVPLADALHAILCKDNNLQLVSRDAHYKKLTNVVRARLPEDFI